MFFVQLLFGVGDDHARLSFAPAQNGDVLINKARRFTAARRADDHCVQGARGDDLQFLPFLLRADDDLVVVLRHLFPSRDRELFELFKPLRRQPFGIFQIVLIESDVLRVNAVHQKERNEQYAVDHADREPIVPVSEYPRKITSRQCEQERHEHAHTDGDKYSCPYPTLPRFGFPMPF